MTDERKGLVPADARRAAGAAGLLASSFDGEVVAAARSLCGLLAKGGLDPATVVRNGLSRSVTAEQRRSPGPQPVPPSSTWQRRARMARGCPDLTTWEREFLASVVELRTLSTRQRDRLNGILAKADRCRS